MAVKGILLTEQGYIWCPFCSCHLPDTIITFVFPWLFPNKWQDEVLWGIYAWLKHALSLSSQWISLCTSLSDNLLLLLASVWTASTVQRFSQSATNLLLLLQMLSRVWCAFSAFTVSGQRIHPFHHQVAVQLPVCCLVLPALTWETPFHHSVV